MGYLNNAGLDYYTDWVKSRRRKLTAGEYNALSDEEKNADVVYMVPETGGSSGGMTQEDADERYLKKTGGETGQFAVSVPNDEYTTETSFSITPDYLDVQLYDAGDGKGASFIIDKYGVKFNESPLLTEQALNSTLETALTPMQEELATKVSVEEFQNAMADGPWLPLSGGEMTGPLSVDTPTADGHAATKGYVDAAIQTAIDGALAASY